MQEIFSVFLLREAVCFQCFDEKQLLAFSSFCLQPDHRSFMQNPLKECQPPAAFVPEAFLEAISNGAPSVALLEPFNKVPRSKYVLKSSKNSVGVCAA